MENGGGAFAMGAGNRDGEKQRIFIVHIIEIQSVTGAKRGQASAFPMEQIFRQRQRNSRPARGERRISHDVALQGLDKSDARVLTAAAARAQLVIDRGLQRNAQPFDAHRIAVIIEAHAGDANARIIAARDQARKKIEMAVRTPSHSGVQNSFRLHWIAGLRLHDHTKSLQL